MNPACHFRLRRWLAVALALGLPVFGAAAAARPNFVVIVADDMGPDDCGAYGNGAVKTPNLDRLARESLRFEHAILTTSSCSPSRASILTGRYPHNTDAEQLHWPLPAAQTLVTEPLRGAGYYTAAAGKWHLGDAVRDRFDRVAEAGTAAFPDSSGAGEAGPVSDASNSRVAKKESRIDDPSGCANWLPVLQRRPRDRPFFLWLASSDPHRTYQPNAIAQPHDPKSVVVPSYLPDTPEVRSDLAHYYDEIARLDMHVGTILDELEKQGVADNTVVVFMSDNGSPFPRAKTTLYDSGIKTPFLVRWPGRVKPGTTTASLISSIDLAPTLLQLAGLPVTSTFQGRSFAALFDDASAIVRRYAHAEHNWHDYDAHERAVRTARYKYIRNFAPELPQTPPADAVTSTTFQTMRRLRAEGRLEPSHVYSFLAPRPVEELYDMEVDPAETKNLAADPAYADALAGLRAELRRWQEETGDPLPGVRAPDGFDRHTGLPLPSIPRQRPSKAELQASAASATR